MSRIDSPPEGSLLKAGTIDVSGVAFAGKRGISAVEVSADGATGIGLTQSAYEYVSPIIEAGPYPLAPLLIGEDPREPRRLWSKVVVTFGAAQGRGPGGGRAGHALAGADVAGVVRGRRGEGHPLLLRVGGAAAASATSSVSGGAGIDESGALKSGCVQRAVMNCAANSRQ